MRFNVLFLLVSVAFAQSDDRRLVRVGDGGPEWKSLDEISAIGHSGAKFKVVSPTQQKRKIALAKQSIATFDSPSQQHWIKELIPQLSIPDMQSDLKQLSSFQNRFAWGPYGADATKFWYETVKNFTDLHNRNDINVTLWNHSDWDPMFISGSILAKIPGSDPLVPITILGAHVDSVNWDADTFDETRFNRAPGEDDDGSGTVNLYQAYKVLLNNNFKPKGGVEFHWYSGEEMGLLGSEIISDAYKSDNVAVKGMMQFDMTAYVKPGTSPIVALQNDTDAGLNMFIASLVDEYLTIPWDNSTSCGYACSDHASWIDNGYIAAFPFESLFENDDPNIHHANDTTDIDGFSWDHSLEFTKLALAFSIEMGE